MKLIKRSIPSLVLGKARTAWVEPSGADPRPLCIFLDGELYLKMAGAKKVVSKVRKTGVLKDRRCVFVSFGTVKERHEHFACNPRYSRFLVKELIPAITGTAKVPDGGHLLVGLSLSGLAAIFTATRFPRIFSRTISQSPSAWWNGEWLRQHMGKRSLRESRFWVSVGSKEKDTDVRHAPTLHQEISQFESSRRLATALRERKGKVRFSIFDGGHQMKCWEKELPNALRWAASPPGSARW
jgi:enterochelin esterase-like enzyme